MLFRSDQLRAFEQQAADSGLTATRLSRRTMNVDMEVVMKEMSQLLQEQQQETFKTELSNRIANMANLPEDETQEDVEARGMEQFAGLVEGQQELLNESIARNTIYTAKYKLVGYNLNIKFHPIAQHFWICDPTVPEMKDQPFCGYYDPMTIQEAVELYPEIGRAHV